MKRQKVLSLIFQKRAISDETHELFANITTWGGIFYCVVVIPGDEKIDKKQVQFLLFAFLGLLFASVCVTGYIGGQLVHVHDI
ncbi:MAG: hypothetical protein Ct9H300mP9_1680 [Candidatus Neomarinimicrobiota bacterium]|nr:MAG: hypothetical protein Ct9H300mP9_1680 [Candidatus Neomarinimicrobiota bacterium]